ncbi:MAG: RNA polymerase sigma factor [Oscillospiraceae bacterium]|nr:RNA polymerase sigma factor [Oscillospiraceae bacterium]
MIDLIGASQGNKAAFEEIVAIYNEKVKKIAGIYVGNNADDVAQDVWVKILNKRHLLSRVDNFDNWLFLVVRNTCFNHLKIEKRRRHHFGLPLHDNIGYTDNLLDEMVRDESIEALRAAINNLSQAYSLPLLMHYSKEMTLADISNALNLPLSTVKWRIHAGKLQIKNEFRKGGYDDQANDERNTKRH